MQLPGVTPVSGSAAMDTITPGAPTPSPFAGGDGPSRSSVARWANGPSAGRWIVLGLVIVASVVLTVGIATPFPWSDEGATYLALQRTWSQVPVLFGGPDAPMVLYYLVAKGWAEGIHAIAPGMQTLLALRLLSAAAAVGTVIALYAIVARNAGRLRGLLAGLVLLCLPTFDRYAQEARAYSLLALAATFSWLIADRRLRPARTPTWLGSSTATEADRGRGATVVQTLGYSATLAAVAVVNTFGLFQWPAHAVAAVAEPGEPRARVRRLIHCVIACVGAALLASVPLLLSVAHGTGPARKSVLTVGTIAAEWVTSFAHVASLTTALVVVVLVVVGALCRIGTQRTFPLALVIWLVVPLLLALAVGLVRPNLFRARYWVAELPPLAALAALGVVAVALWLVTGVRGALRPGLTAVALAALSAVMVAVTLPTQAAIRQPNGHGEDLSQVDALIAQTRAEYPGLAVVFTSAFASGMLATHDPPLLAENPLLSLVPSRSTVYTGLTGARTVKRDLAGVRHLLWLYWTANPPISGRLCMPRNLADLHPKEVWREPAGDNWSVVLLDLPPGRR